MANAWIQHVKEYAKKNGIKYPVAVGDPGCKAAYKKGTQKKNRKYGGAELIVEQQKADLNADPKAAAEPKTPVNNVEVNHNPNADSEGDNPSNNPLGGKRRSRKAKGSKSRSKKSRKNKK